MAISTVEDTGWHSDGGWPRPIRFYKMAFYLDPLTADTGQCVSSPEATDMENYICRNSPTEHLQSGRDLCARWTFSPCGCSRIEPGGLGDFQPSLETQFSWGGGTQRRMFTINCGYRYKEDEIHFLRKELDLVSRFGEGKVYGDKMIETAGPERRGASRTSFGTRPKWCLDRC